MLRKQNRIVGGFAWWLVQQIFVETLRHKTKLEKNIDTHKSSKHNRSLIRHNRSIIMLRSLSPTRKWAVKPWKEASMTQNNSRVINSLNINIL